MGSPADTGTAGVGSLVSLRDIVTMKFLILPLIFVSTSLGDPEPQFLPPFYPPPSPPQLPLLLNRPNVTDISAFPPPPLGFFNPQLHHPQFPPRAPHPYQYPGQVLPHQLPFLPPPPVHSPPSPPAPLHHPQLFQKPLKKPTPLLRPTPVKVSEQQYFSDGGYVHDPIGDKALPYVHDTRGDKALPYVHNTKGDGPNRKN